MKFQWRRIYLICRAMNRHTGLIITLTDPATDCAQWSSGPAKWDIRVQLNTGVVIYSSTVSFTVLPQITLD